MSAGQNKMTASSDSTFEDVIVSGICQLVHDKKPRDSTGFQIGASLFRSGVSYPSNPFR